MKTLLKPFFNYTKSQRAGLIWLLSIIVLLQILHYVDIQTPNEDSAARNEWLAYQPKLDSIKAISQKKASIVYRFNPNFITDHKGYMLGMSVEEIDRLHEFRKLHKYVNSAAEFQEVTKVSDSLLSTFSSLFKFPDWVNQPRVKSAFKPFKKFEKPNIVRSDINQATIQDLDKVYGIGETLAGRILKFKNSLGAIVDMRQLDDVYGLSPEVIEKLNEHFFVGSAPTVIKVDLNNATIKELSQFPYFKYALAKQIVTYRSMNGDIRTIEDLTKIKGFPVDKAHIIALYLEF